VININGGIILVVKLYIGLSVNYVNLFFRAPKGCVVSLIHVYNFPNKR